MYAKRLWIIASLLLLASLPLRATTVSGTLRDLGATAATSANTYVLFTLQNYSSNIPRVSNTSVVVSPEIRFRPDGTGAISGTIQGNDTITPTATFYRVCIFYNGAQFRCYNFTITGSTFNLNSATPNTTAPVATAPTGDTTYLRLDGGNTMTGSLPAVSIGLIEAAAPGGVAGRDLIYGDSTAHRPKVKNNNGSADTLALFTDKLSVFAGTTSAELAGVLSDETGSGGGFVRATGPALASPTTTGTDNGTETLGGKTIDTANSNTLKVGGVDVSTALTSYSPTAASTAGTITSKTVTGKYKQIGKMVFVQIRIAITTNGTGAGSIQADLPVASNASLYTMSGRTSVTGFQVQGVTVSGAATLALFNYDNTYPGADGAVIVISGWYETT